MGMTILCGSALFTSLTSEIFDKIACSLRNTEELILGVFTTKDLKVQAGRCIELTVTI